MIRQLPLSDVVVLDFSRILAGPYCTMILADMGARVYKIENPDGGDDSRSFGPYVAGESAYFAGINRNKLSLCLNLKHPRAKELALAMVRRADVVIENFRPGTMDRLGLGYDTLRDANPRVIYAAVSGFGHSGPYMMKPGYDIVAQAMSGLMSITGHPGGPPTRVGASVGDLTGGMFAAIGILAALHERQRSGVGQKVDVALLDSQVAILENAVTRYLTTGEVPTRIGNRHPSISPFTAVKTADGHVIIAVGNDGLWARFCGVVGLAELASDERFATNHLRTANWEELEPLLAPVFGTRTTDAWIACLEAHGIPCGPINTIDRVVDDPQVKARRMIRMVDHPVAGPLPVTALPIKLSRTPVDDEFRAAPSLGEHTKEALRELLGLSDAELGELREAGVL
jgi:CoA:oxalate CoA-transferase